MFLIFKFLPDWIWLLLLASGILGFLFSYLPQVKTYALILKSLSATTIAVTIFVLGVLYSDNTWKAAAADLQAKVIELSRQSDSVNTEIKEKTITKIQVVKVRGDEITKYIDREVAKSDSSCVIPSTFVSAHNQAAEASK